MLTRGATSKKKVLAVPDVAFHSYTCPRISDTTLVYQPAGRFPF
jgi:hypothetical protein